ncbi:hypothetical protein AK812_SmicGene8300 [Symbiodinium microadriaticum]|uniref:Integrase catalytic domain-containing protein n=1 Tax=Symbiodinium microadriaticum TaxID=2951 RepID=A0A1Q9ELK0_SYMMI|nr:hypothetical protein AK812_SmicGene8300 [Symbiodinium microadriaticum]CAE7787384.1 unnamed protein product [Symbiodinium sp. KB8]
MGCLRQLEVDTDLLWSGRVVFRFQLRAETREMSYKMWERMLLLKSRWMVGRMYLGPQTSRMNPLWRKTELHLSDKASQDWMIVTWGHRLFHKSARNVPQRTVDPQVPTWHLVWLRQMGVLGCTMRPEVFRLRGLERRSLQLETMQLELVGQATHAAFEEDVGRQFNRTRLQVRPELRDYHFEKKVVPHDHHKLVTGRIDAQPTVDDVLKYHQHLQAEIENIVISKTTARSPSEGVSGEGAQGASDIAWSRRATSQEEWQAANPLLVHLAGGEVVSLKMNAAGTLLVPICGATRSTSSSPIVLLGALVGVLGYKMEWHGTRCKLTGRDGEVLNLRVRDGCPEIMEHQALELISRIEDSKLNHLREATASTKAKVRESMVVLDKSWFDHLLAYSKSGLGSDALLAIHSAPFFQGLPEGSLYGLAEADPISNGWDALRGLEHLNRRSRKKLWSSKHSVVHLFAGKRTNEEVMFLERQGFAVLELDLERGKTHDICNPLVWRAIEWGARSGRIAAVIGGPPQNTFMLRRHMSPGPEPLRSADYPYGGWYGQSERDQKLVNKHTGLFVKMIYLHALATAGRCTYPPDPSDVKEVGFLLEQPSDPRVYAFFDDRLAQDSVSICRDFEDGYSWTLMLRLQFENNGKLQVPKTFIDDGRGAGIEFDAGELDEDVPPEEGSFDFEGDPIGDQARGSDSAEPELQVETGVEDEADEDIAEVRSEKRLGPEEDLDLSGPEIVNLIFATALQDNKSATVLEAIQDVVTYCWALNIPVVRFHCDRGMEFYAKATRQWIKYHGMRFTTSEGGLHQQNGMVENAVRYVKQRARYWFGKGSTEVTIWDFRKRCDEAELMVQEEEVSEDLSKLEGIATSDGAVFFEKQFLGVHHEVPDSQDAVYVGTEELEHWDMFLPLSSGDPGEVPKAMIASCDGVPRLHKTEVVYTKGIEGLLGALQSPLTVVHNVDPTEAAACFEKWVAPVQKELRSFDSAAVKIQSTDRQVREDLRTGKAKVVPMKVVYTVKPPSEQAAADGELFRRKARVVACGNMMAESGEETYAGTAPAEVVRSSLSISSLRGWDAATLDVTAAFLQTPLKEVQCQQRILGQPPRALVRAGLCGEHELWEFTHAVYGLRESPRWWGEFRDHQLAQLNVVLGTRKIKLLQCGVEGGWWRLVEGDALVGIVVVYVDDLLICSIPSIIMAVSDAVRVEVSPAAGWGSSMAVTTYKT